MIRTKLFLIKIQAECFAEIVNGDLYDTVNAKIINPDKDIVDGTVLDRYLVVYGDD